jgi:acyl-CoA synthetase (AMP-forming)/AMP-acid ligase II/thioesterase domain-containing protein/cytochrome P450
MAGRDGKGCTPLEGAIRDAVHCRPRRPAEQLCPWLIEQAAAHGAVFKEGRSDVHVLFGAAPINSAFDGDGVHRLGDAVSRALEWNGVTPLPVSSVEERSRRRPIVQGALRERLACAEFNSALLHETMRWASRCLAMKNISMNAEVFRHVGVRISFLLLDGAFTDYDERRIVADLRTSAASMRSLDGFPGDDGITSVLSRLVDGAQAPRGPANGFVHGLTGLSRDEQLNEAAHLVSSLAHNAPGIVVGALAHLERHADDLAACRAAAAHIFAGDHGDVDTAAQCILATVLSPDNALYRVVSEASRLYAQPITAVGRTSADLCLDGVRIPANAAVVATYKSSGLDDRDFPDPMTFSSQRDPAPLPGARHCPLVGGAFGVAADDTANHCLFEDGSKWVMIVAVAAFIRTCSWQRHRPDEVVTSTGFGEWDLHTSLRPCADEDQPAEHDDYPPVMPSTAKPSAGPRRIAVIGAGIGGITAARRLTQLGHNVVVYESGDTPYGKCPVSRVDGVDYNMGAHIIQSDGPVVQLAESLGCPVDPFPAHRIYDVESGCLVERQGVLSQQVETFREVCEASAMASSPSSLEGSHRLAASVTTWLAANDLTELRRDVGAFFSGAGYGVLLDDEDSIPAAYLVKFALMIGATDTKRAGSQLSQGFADLLAKASADFDVRCNHRCKSVTVAAHAHALDVEFTNGETASFDEVVLACGVGAHDVFAVDGHFAQHHAILGTLRTNRYCTVLMRVNGLPCDTGVFVPQDTRVGCVSAIVHSHAATNVYQVCGYLSAGQSLDELSAAFVAELERCGHVSVLEVLDAAAFAMFPRFDSAVLADDIYSQLEALQGCHGVWLAGSIMTFELTDSIVDYSSRLALRINAAAAASRGGSSSNVHDHHPPTIGRDNPTILDRFADNVDRHPQRPLYTYVDAKTTTTKAKCQQSWTDVARGALLVAAKLASVGVKKGDRVALVFPPDSANFAFALWGCLISGVIAVPLAPSKTYGADDGLDRLATAFEAAQVSLVFTDTSYKRLTWIGGLLDKTASVLTWSGSTRSLWSSGQQWITVDECDNSGAPRHSSNTDLSGALRRILAVTEIRGDDVAYLQYSSGTTSAPKGVVITHRMLMHNLDVLSGCVPGLDCMLSWIPWWHDFGLVAGFFLGAYSGAHYVALSPVEFIRNPLGFLKAIHQFQPQAVAAPNFALRLMLDKVSIADAAGLDLSSVCSFALGGEAVEPMNLRDFAARFSTHNRFDADCFANNYGAAESTLYICGGQPGGARTRSFDLGSLDDGRSRVVKLGASTANSPCLEITACGVPQRDLGIVVRIVDENRRLCPDRVVGEVWVSSPSCATRYWSLPSANTASGDKLSRQLHGDSTGRRYVATGDRGFMFDGELFIRGRIANMIIHCGKNVHAEDVQAACAGVHAHLRKGRLVAFALPAEVVMVVAETHHRHEATDVVMHAIQARVAATLGVRCRVALVAPGTLKKTTSGKLRAAAVRTAYLADELTIWAQTEAAESGSAMVGASVRGGQDPTAMCRELPPRFADTDGVDERIAATLCALEIMVSSILTSTELATYARSMTEGTCSANVPFSLDETRMLAELGLSSIDMLGLCQKLSEWLDYTVSPHQLFVAQSVKATATDLIAAVAAAAAAAGLTTRVSDLSGAPQMVCLLNSQVMPAGDALNIFAIHPAGGSIACYTQLALLLGKSNGRVNFHAIECLHSRVPLNTRAANYADMIRAVQPAGPYFFACYSLGGTIAQAVLAKHLPAPPAGSSNFVVMVDAPAPSYSESTAKPRLDDAAFESFEKIGLIKAEYVEAMRQQTAYDVQGSFVSLSAKDVKRAGRSCTTVLLRAAVEDDEKRIGLTPERLEGEAIAVRDQLQHPHFDDEDFGWADVLVTGSGSSLVVERTPGDHFSVMAPWNIGSVADAVTRHLTCFLSQNANTAAHN